MTLHVDSEIGTLREVLVHLPGPEVDSMPPELMGEFLFDDILYGPGARSEHARFTAVLRCLGAKVTDFSDLLVGALEHAGDARRELLDTVARFEELPRSTSAELAALGPSELAEVLIAGQRVDRRDLSPENLFRILPVPNLLFSRDAQVVLGDGVVISGMSRRARQREALLSRFVFTHHPRFGPETIRADFAAPLRRASSRTPALPTLEGGDILVFREGVVVAGVSERTMERGVDRLTETLRSLDRFRALVMVPLPRQRSAMHLDTIFTRTSEDDCLVYAPLILPGGPETLSVITIDLARAGDWGRRRPSLLEALRELGVDLRPISCGGEDDYIQQAREQWTDGANSFAQRPGLVYLYARNTRTAEELEKRGYHVLSVDEMDFGPDGECRYAFTEGTRYAILVAGHELSRARGGPRCMTMPLVRAPA